MGYLAELCAILGPTDKDDQSSLQAIITPSEIITTFDWNLLQDKLAPASPSLLNSLEWFYFPHGHKTYEYKIKSGVEYGVFTDEQGSRIYLYCLILPFKSCSSSNEIYSMKKICFFSKYRCFNIMKDVLQSMYLLIEKSKMVNKEVQDLLKIISNVLIPPKGKLDVTFRYGNELFTVPCPTFYGFSDVPYTLPFFYFNHEMIVEIFVAIITEQQVVFIGNSKTTNILLMECFLCYIFPMEWIAPYLPILPEKLYGMFDALGYFIFGSNHAALEEIDPEGNIIVVDVDHGTVTYSEQSVRYRVDDFVIARFKERLPHSAFSFLSSSNEHIFESREVLEREKNDFDIKLNAQVFISMQYLMFDIYEGLLTFQMSAKMQLSLKGDQRKEHVGESLNKLQYHLKESMMRSNLRIKFNNPYLERQFFSTLDLLKSQPIDKVLKKFMATKRSNETIEFTSNASENLTSIEKRLAVCRDPSVKSSLLYLKSLLLLQMNKPVKAFQSLNKIFETGIEDFPASETIALLQKLEYNSEVYNEILSQAFMKQPVWIPLTTDLGHTDTILNISSQSTYTHLEVPDLLTQLGMTRNHSMGRKIFDVLKSDKGVLIGHDIKNFCGIWKSFKKTLDYRHLPIVPNRKEKIVKISSQEEVTGAGLYIVCTIFRLYMVNYITDQATASIELTEIVDLSIKNNGIVFKLSSGVQQVAENIRNSTNWFVILEELIGATSKYKKTKDYNNLMDARANILIFESLNQYEKQYGELVNPSECQEQSSSFYWKGKVKNSDFLLFREEFLNCRNFSRSVSRTSTGHGTENVLCRFSPNPRVKETIYTLITHNTSIFVGTKNCNIYRISQESSEVEDHISLMFTNFPSQWTLYSFLLIEGALWVPLKYTTLSLYIISTANLHHYQTLSLPHEDHVVGVVHDGGSLCYITSIDGATSLWCTATRTLLRSIRGAGHGLMSCCTLGTVLVQAVRDTLFTLQGNDFIPHQADFSLIKITATDRFLFGIDKNTPQVIRCYSRDLEHETDIHNTVEDPVSSFINLYPYNNTHLIITTKNNSLLVYSLTQCSFIKSISNAHSDLISAITVTDDGTLVTGSKSADGNICLWVDMFQ